MIAVDALLRHFQSLTSRQAEVALLLADGLSNTEISGRLNVTVHTVKAHRAEVMRRMGANSFAQLVGQLLQIRLANKPPEIDDSAQIRIVVVEDDAWYRDYLTAALQERQFLVRGVANAAEFDADWAQQPADVVVLDIELGQTDVDGLTLASRLLAMRACGVIMVTRRGEVADRIKGLTIGADAYFAKPVNVDELAVTIVNLCKRLR
ncbi:response regulator [Hydrogenophaga sp.]|uniref:response regulator n=1 Tax=Hydrogenophaga sp. TaxID=1904254 RepID=UPI002727A8A3|nr:response regulator [Hydrogenophaga sp.]MDO9133622.1 response regulator [Hydrogenophaga sp.]